MSFTSPYPEVDIPDVSLYEFLFDGLTEADLERPALLDGTTGAETTYRALRDQIDAVAGALAARGLGFGEVVAVHVPNVPAFAAVLHGVLRAGGTATTVHALYTSEEITKQLTDAKARFLFTRSRSSCPKLLRRPRRQVSRPSGSSCSMARRGMSRWRICSPLGLRLPGCAWIPRRIWQCCRTRRERPATPRG